MTTYCLFDCDGVLLEKPRDTIVAAFIREREGNEIPEEVICIARQKLTASAEENELKTRNEEERQNFYLTYNEHLLRLLGFAATRDDARALFDRFAATPYRVYPDVLPALEACKKHGDCLLGVLSNWTFRLESVLTQTGLRPYFSHVLPSATLGVAKPDPAFFLRALDVLGAPHSMRFFYIGDQYDLDIAPVPRDRITPILLDRTGSSGKTPDCTCIRSLMEFLSML